MSSLSPVQAAYSVVFLGVLFSSIINFWLTSGPPICSEMIRLLSPLGRNYEILPTSEPGDNTSNEPQEAMEVEPLSGWRFRSGALLTSILLVLTILHSLIWLEDRDSLFQVIFIIYWVSPILYMTNSLKGIVLLYSSLRFLPTFYRRSLYTATISLGIVPLGYHIHVDILPHLYINNQASNNIYTSVAIALTCITNLIPLFTPRLYRPVDRNSKTRPAPQQVCTPISRYFTLFYLEYLVRRGMGHELGMDDLPPLPDDYQTQFWRDRFLKSRCKSTIWKLIDLSRLEIFWSMPYKNNSNRRMFFWAFLETIVTFGTTFALNNLLAFLEVPANSALLPGVWVGALLVLPILTSVFLQQYLINAFKLSTNTEAALTQVVYEKTLRVRVGFAPANDGGETERDRVGRINNLMSSDIETISAARDNLVYLFTIPVCVIVALAYLYSLLGWSALVGFGCMLLLYVPLSALLVVKSAKIQEKVTECSDERIGVISELLNNIRAVKYFGWETAMMGRVDKKREAEQRMIWKSSIIGILLNFVDTLMPLINLAATLFTFTIIQKKELRSSTAFTSIALFEMLSSQLSQVGEVAHSTMMISLNRIDKYLNGEEEIEENPVSNSATIRGDSPPFFRNAVFSWGVIDTEGTDFELRNLNVTFCQGGLNLIIGATGSGKSSLLLALLSEMRIVRGEAYLPRERGVAYVSQTAWLQNATIRDNILFGSNFDPDRYGRVIAACALEPDLRLWEAGDETEVGEKGLTLSGGQKQRIALARAVYSHAQTLLLDDVLSSLDVHVAKQVFEDCIMGPILRARTVILVTHNTNLTRKYAEKIVVMEHGSMVACLDPSDILTSPIIERVVEDDMRSNDEVALEPTPNQRAKLVPEEQLVGHIPRKTVFEYMSNFGRPVFVAGLWALVCTGQAGDILLTWWLARWTDSYEEHVQQNAAFYLNVGAIIVSGIALNKLGTDWLFELGAWRAARILHHKLVRGVFHAPVSWFDATPIGRVINRFSRDISNVDYGLLGDVNDAISLSLQAAFRIAAVTGVMPLFVAPAIVIAIVAYILGDIYVRTDLALTRCYSVTESPIFSHFGDTVIGTVTIRAFGAQTRFAKQNSTTLDTHLRASLYLFLVNRWIDIRSDTLGSVMTFVGGLLALHNRDLTPGLVGFSLVKATGLGDTILSLVRTLNELEIGLNGYQRIMQYVTLPSEPAPMEHCKPPPAWPTDGGVVVNNLSVKYTDGPMILSNISLSIESKERVGICGRTGAGKTTFCLSLLRFTEKISGSILIGGIDIDRINLEDLRDRVTIIPQDPVLFSGTIRSNLDPFCSKDDADLIAALHHSGLLDSEIEDQSVSSGAVRDGTVDTVGLVSPRISLDTPVTSNGDNLSQGQRQILAIARALVRQSRVIILDESTASVDHVLDERIQRTLRSAFKESTVITIAHRLSTIMDYDKILILDKGQVMEFDTPLRLLDRKGLFYAMVSESGEMAALVNIAMGKPGMGKEDPRSFSSATSSAFGHHESASENFSGQKLCGISS